MVKLSKRLEASTLQETIIAMSIIMFVFSIAMLVFGNVFRADNMQLDFKGNLILEQYFHKKSDSKSDDEDSFDELPQFKVERIYYPYPYDTDLKIMQVSVYSLNGKLIASQKEIYIIKENLKQ